MPNYQNGKIYKITSPSTDKIYIGSTVRKLSERFCSHKSDFKRFNYTNKPNITSSIKVLQYNDCIIELIENYPCNTKRELEFREQFYMNLYKDSLVNQQSAICNISEKNKKSNNSEKRKEWTNKNREYINKIHRRNYHLNKEKNNERQRYLYELNKEKISEQRKLRKSYQNSWGGDKRSNNNLLEIDIDLFN